MALPKGGGSMQGLECDFSVDYALGGAAFSIPIPVTPCRNSEPKLRLEYRSGAGNGAFGMGFCVPIPYITRSSRRKVPGYRDGEDSFSHLLLGDLTELSMEVLEDGTVLRTYRPFREEVRLRIEYRKRGESSDWTLTYGDGRVQVYGQQESERVCRPGCPESVFRWHLSMERDKNGNQARYTYLQDLGYAYPDRISYGLLPGPSEEAGERYGFSVCFAYGEPGTRRDVFTGCRSGFPVTIDRLCTGISVCHSLQKGEDARLVRRMLLEYEEGAVSLLKRVQVVGVKPPQGASSKDGPCMGQEAANGTVWEEALPPLSFSYTGFGTGERTFSRLMSDHHAFHPDPARGTVRFADLYGDGISGILYCDGKAVYFARAEGGGRYGEFSTVREYPADRGEENLQCVFQSLRGDGSYALTVYGKDRNGFYECRNGEWQPFESFRTFPTEEPGRLEFADIHGTGRLDLLAGRLGETVCYPAETPEEYGAPFMLEGGMPSVSGGDGNRKISYMNFLGDGLSCPVWVENGCIAYWPCLGNGKFGKIRYMEGVPSYDGFDAKRVYFADMDGSGTMDLIYALPDRAEIYINCGGKRFAGPVRAAFPERMDDRAQLLFADVTGMGCQSILFVGGGRDAGVYTCRLWEDAKPYLLKGIDHHTGLKEEISYVGSVSLYLKARKDGAPWSCHAPFCVPVVEKWVTRDAFAHLIREQRYEYRNDSYDPAWREFYGFARVEEWSRLDLDTGQAPPYQSEMRHTCLTYRPGPVLTREDRAMKGRLLRREIYGPGETGGEERCYETQDYRYEIRELTDPADGGPGSFYVLERERLVSRFDGGPDPAVTHRLVLEEDDFHCIVTEAELSYTRGTKRVEGICTQRAYIHREDACHGLLWEEKRYELAGRSVQGVLSYEDAASWIGLARKRTLPYLADWEEDGAAQMRLLHWQRDFYWDAGLAQPLPAGQASAAQLLHHRKTARYPAAWIQKTVGERLEVDRFGKDLGLVLEEGYFWANGGVVSYFPAAGFYRPKEWEAGTRVPGTQRTGTQEAGTQEDSGPWGRLSIAYDRNFLYPVKQTRFLEPEEETAAKKGGAGSRICSLSVSGEMDEDCMRYCRLVDENRIITEALLDPLGRPRAMTRYDLKDPSRGNGPLSGYRRIEEGLERILESPQRYLQEMSEVYGYGEQGERRYILEIRRQAFASEQKEEAGICTVSYLDGRGNIVQQKQGNGGLWAADGYRILLSEGRILKSYWQFYSSHAGFVDRTAGNVPAMETVWYDGMERERRRTRYHQGPENVKGTLLSAASYGPWERTTWEFRDLVKESDYYRQLKRAVEEGLLLDEEAEDAAYLLERVALYAQTPVRERLDGRGNVVERARGDADRTVFYEYDIQNRLLSLRRAGEEERAEFSYLYDMEGNEILCDSRDKGRRLRLLDCLGREVHCWEETGIHRRYFYDALGRSTGQETEGAGRTELTVYGEENPACVPRNMLGKPWKQKDCSGEREWLAYDQNGHALECLVRIEGREAGKLSYEFDAAGKMLRRGLPDGSSAVYGYDGLGRTNRISLVREGREEVCIEDVSYAPCGMPSGIRYGNGLEWARTYHPAEGLLMSHSLRNREGTLLESASYRYDTQGNVLRIRKHRENPVSGANGKRGQTAGKTDYEYDGDGRLVQARGQRRIPGSAPSDTLKTEPYTETYRYDGKDNLISLENRAPSQSLVRSFMLEEGTSRLSAVDGQTVETDRAGRILRMPGIQGLEWDCNADLRRAVSVMRKEGDSDGEQYDYDSRHRRVRKLARRRRSESLTEVTEQIYLDQYEEKRIWQETGEGEKKALLKRSTFLCMLGEELLGSFYFWDQDEGGRETDTPGNGLACFMVSNQIRSAESAYDGTGNLLFSEEFTPYGTTCALWQAKGRKPPRQYRFCAKEQDTITGFYYYLSRYYCPYLARMVSADRADTVLPARPGTWNLFAYCEDNPVSRQDPAGTCAKPVVYNAPNRVMRTNCYAFALDFMSHPETGARFHTRYEVAGEFAAQPGMFSNTPLLPTGAGVEAAFFADMASLGHHVARLPDADAPVSEGCEKICLVTGTDPWGNWDYHWYREVGDVWYHKPGETEVTCLDALGKRIRNPAKASRDYSGGGGVNYRHVQGFYEVSRRPTLEILVGGVTQSYIPKSSVR